MIDLRIASLVLVGATATVSVNAPMLRQQVATSLGFETRDASNRPLGWYAGGAGYEVAMDSVSPLAGRYSLRTRWIEPATRDEQAFGVVTNSYSIAMARGRALRLVGYIRTEAVTSGYAGFWLRVDGVGRVIALDNMNARGATGTTPWTRYEIEMPVDSGATAVYYGALHPGVGTAWFDSLTLEVVGPARPRTVSDAPPFQGPPRIREDSSRLLTDAELALAPDSVAPPAENPTWLNWVRRNAHPVRSLGSTDFKDLRFLAPVLAGKRVVQLGESGHGVAEFDLAKVRLIKYMHEELGYDVIAFESSVFECDRAQKAVATLTADAMMRSCIFGVWHAAETRPLFDYIKQTQSTARPLLLAGFDSQTSSASANARPAFFRDLVAKVDASYAAIVFERDTRYLNTFRGGNTPAIARDREVMVAFYDSLATWLRTNQQQLESLSPDDRFAPMIGRQTATSMVAFTKQMALGPALGTPIRDVAMADNLDFLLAERYPGKKVMVWAHNFHIQHRENVATKDDGSAGSTPTTMGVWTARRHRAELYTVGLFMYRGAAAANTGAVYPIGRMPAGSLESIMHGAPWRYSYVDLSRQSNTPETSWMFQRIPAMSWGTQPDPLVPRDEYDGILFIDTTHPPTYLRAPAR